METYYAVTSSEEFVEIVLPKTFIRPFKTTGFMHDIQQQIVLFGEFKSDIVILNGRYKNDQYIQPVNGCESFVIGGQNNGYWEAQPITKKVTFSLKLKKKNEEEYEILASQPVSFHGPFRKCDDLIREMIKREVNERYFAADGLEGETV